MGDKEVSQYRDVKSYTSERVDLILQEYFLVKQTWKNYPHQEVKYLRYIWGIYTPTSDIY